MALYQAHVVKEDGELSEYNDSMTNVSDENLEWGLDYSQIHAPHVRLTQDHEIRIKMLEEENTQLKSKISDLENKVEQLAKLLMPQEETQE